MGDSKSGSRGSDGLFEAGGGMGRPLYQQIGFDAPRQVTHVPLSESSGSACHRYYSETPYSETSSHAWYRQVMHGGSGGGVMFTLLLLDRRSCDDSRRQVVWDDFVFRCLLQRYPAIKASMTDKGGWYRQLQR